MTLSPETQAALREAVTREQILELLLEAGAPIKRVGDDYAIRSDYLHWLTSALGFELSDVIIFEEGDD